MTFNRINGWHLFDGAALHHQMGLRGITAGQLADASGLTQATLSRISRGYIHVRPTTMEKIAKGLKKFPVIEGVEALLVAPDGNVPEDKMVGGTHVAPPPIKRVPKLRRRPLWPDEGTPPAFVNGLRVIEERPKKTAAPRPTSP